MRMIDTDRRKKTHDRSRGCRTNCNFPLTSYRNLRWKDSIHKVCTCLAVFITAWRSKETNKTSHEWTTLPRADKNRSRPLSRGERITHNRQGTNHDSRKEPKQNGTKERNTTPTSGVKDGHVINILQKVCNGRKMVQQKPMESKNGRKQTWWK